MRSSRAISRSESDLRRAGGVIQEDLSSVQQPCWVVHSHLKLQLQGMEGCLLASEGTALRCTCAHIDTHSE